jgi:hypothetical protein
MIVKTIKTYLWQRALNARLANRNRVRISGSLITAKDLFVVYDASEEVQNKHAEAFFVKLKSLDIKVKSLGYAKYKIIPHYCIPQLSRQFICQKDLNLFGVPHKPFLDDFLDDEVDLLISLDQEQDPVLQYLAAVSMAKFKVGWNHPDNLPYFDYLIGSSPGDLPDYFDQLIHYLSINNT